uniref:NOF-FB transposable element protein n=1 Tax=Sipha flava TaxID=143950 RepID=A0A2S2QSI1_9HEMI
MLPTFEYLFQMAGKKCNYDKNDLLEVLRIFKTDILNALGKSTDSLWERICNHFGNKIKPSALYTIIKCNRYNCHEVLGINEEAYSDNEDSTSNDTCISDEPIDYLKYENIFEINYHSWLSMLSTDKLSLKTGWTHKMFEYISPKLENNCILMFKRHSLNPTSSINYFGCQGYCKECKATINIRCMQSPKENENVKLYYTLSKVNEKNHTYISKRPLSGTVREEVSKKICDGKMAVNWRRDFITQNQNTRTLYSLDVLRKSRQEYKEKTQFKNISSGKNVLESLQCLKYEEEYNTSIHKIGLDPFHVFYWTPAQTIVYNHYIQKENNSILLIDATGTLCKTIERPYNNVSSHIFLYQGVIQTGLPSGQLPVTQMLSECHNINQINYWLSDWMTSAKTPKIVICDHSLALLGGIARSIAGEVNLKSYMDKAFSIITMQSAITLKTFIRVDYAHVMKFVSNWKCFKDSKANVKRFYLKVISRLVMCTTIENAEAIIQNVLITSNSEYEGFTDNDRNSPSESENAKMYLKKAIAGMNEIVIEYEDDSLIAEGLENEENFEGCLHTWILNLKQIAEDKYVTTCSDFIYENNNYHFLPSFTKSFITFLRTYPLWSAIMTKHFNVSQLTASSASVESYFNDLKNRSFHNEKLPIRTDKFIYKHLKEIEGMLKLSKHDEQYKQNKDLLKEPNQKFEKDSARIDTDFIKNTQRNIEETMEPKILNNKDNEDNIIYLEFKEPARVIENWRRLGCKKKLRSSYYAAPNPEIMHSIQQKKIEIALIKNGSIVNRTKPTKSHNDLFILKNTCPYDSILQAIACAYCDSKDYSTCIENNSESINIYNITKTLVTEGFSKMFILQRVDLLKNICKSERLIDNTILLRCEGNISASFEKICYGLESATESYTCSDCNFVWYYKKKIFSLLLENFDYLETIVKNSFHEILKCRMCDTENCVTVEICDQLWIDCDIMKVCPLDLPIKLSFNKTLTLRAVIVYSGSTNTKAIGHYSCICRRNDGAWEIYNDTQNKVTIARTSISQNVTALFYTI